ncbi:hypothetical protein MMC12_000986 [Toensbergia leucococca]|nr:hypothetical protein [Toensbergia leucococca]
MKTTASTILFALAATAYSIPLTGHQKYEALDTRATVSFPGFPTFPSIAPVSPSTVPSSSSSTDNDILNDAGCKALTVIFARGTTEPGNVGSVAGPPFISALKTDLGVSQVAAQGVDYPATAATIATEGGNGSTTMVDLVAQALSQCPTTKIVLSGYSQGGEVVHGAATSLSTTQTSAISSVVLFGDPFNGQKVGSIPSSKVLEICATGDDVCNGSGTYTITAAHLSYGNNATQAASFVVQKSGLSAAS